VKSLIKKLALKTLPEWALTPLRKRHYLNVLKNLSDDYDPDFAIIRQLVQPGDYVIDLGAHVGAVTKFLSDLVGPQGRVYSVEPFPINYEILKRNVGKLKLHNVELINCAVSDQKGRLTMEIPTFDEMGESFYDARLIPAGAESSLRHAEVDVKTVDDMFAGIPRGVSFVKCDVEGQELQTLRGAKQLIEAYKPAWLLEISLMPAQIHDQVKDLLGGYGYQEFCFENGKLREWNPADKPVDVFFLQPEHLEKFDRSI
jgi:FkbM family methyltransferase